VPPCILQALQYLINPRAFADAHCPSPVAVVLAESRSGSAPPNVISFVSPNRTNKNPNLNPHAAKTPLAMGKNPVEWTKRWGWNMFGVSLGTGSVAVAISSIPYSFRGQTELGEYFTPGIRLTAQRQSGSSSPSSSGSSTWS
jgi:hypothetical protein